MEFDEAFDRTVPQGNAWIRDPKDPANWTGGHPGVGDLCGTRYGICAAKYPELDIEHLDEAQAREIYRRDVWDRCSCDLLPDWLRRPIFEVAFLAGTMVSIIWMQRAVGVTANGIVSACTVSAARSANPGATIARLSAYLLDDITDSYKWQTHGRDTVRRIAKALLEVEV